jgi:predicted DNA-binding transcriptional regulator AlpA
MRKKRERDWAALQAKKKAKALRNMPGLTAGKPVLSSDQEPSPTPTAKKAKVPPVLRLLNRAEVLAVVGCSYTTLWEMMQRAEFPRGRIRGGKTVWLSNEIEEWMQQLPVRPIKGDAA